ncbi:hypothetical protein B0H16DRAFT_1729833 [Mycena metata]|uniref:Uncharacterized protein n=1 Tax=Mycena metata TaxID=1033252 RepID=A0AAD7IA98_9AGAR|nr:hypothetical protein B0H16DRAFT_1729833 [Mycena metata]
MEDVNVAENPHFGPIKFGNRTWAHEVDKIVVTLYSPGDDVDNAAEYDVTPVPHGDEKEEIMLYNQSVVSEIIMGVTRTFVGDDVFLGCFGSPEDFDFDWDAFYTRLGGALREDAFDRYLRWRPRVTDPVIPVGDNDLAVIKTKLNQSQIQGRLEQRKAKRANPY